MATRRCGHTVKAAARVDGDHETGWVAGAGSVELVTRLSPARTRRPSSGVNGFGARPCLARRSTIAPARRRPGAVTPCGQHLRAVHPRSTASPQRRAPSTPTAVSGHIDMWLVDHPGHTTMWPPSSAVDRAPRHAARVLVVATWRCGPPKAGQAAAVVVDRQRIAVAGTFRARTRRPRSARAKVMQSSILILRYRIAVSTGRAPRVCAI